MKKMKVVGLVVGLIGILSVGNVMAGDSTQVNVSAVVAGTCSFNAASYAMDFGTINVTDTGAKTATATLEFNCTNNTSYTLDDVSGSRTLTGATDTMAYSISAYATTGTASGGTDSVTLTGTITEAVYTAANADTYSENITINITP